MATDLIGMEVAVTQRAPEFARQNDHLFLQAGGNFAACASGRYRLETAVYRRFVNLETGR